VAKFSIQHVKKFDHTIIFVCTALLGLFPVLPHVLFSAVFNDSNAWKWKCWEGLALETFIMEAPVGHKTDTGTGGVASFSGSTHHAALYSGTLYCSHACMDDSYLYFRFRVLNEVKVVESKLQECHIHLDREKATQKEKGVMSGVMLILWNLYVTRVLLPFRI